MRPFPWRRVIIPLSFPIAGTSPVLFFPAQRDEARRVEVQCRAPARGLCFPCSLCCERGAFAINIPLIDIFGLMAALAPCQSKMAPDFMQFMPNKAHGPGRTQARALIPC